MVCMQLAMQRIKLKKHSAKILELLLLMVSRKPDDFKSKENTITCISETAIKMMIL